MGKEELKNQAAEVLKRFIEASEKRNREKFLKMLSKVLF